MIKFSDFPLDKIGRGMGLVGGIWADEDNAYVFLFPDYSNDDWEMWEVDMTSEEWRTLLRQTDLIELPVAVKGDDGKVYKAILRKCQRRIEQGVVWGVYKRDGYTCRYCGRDGLPLTVDHLVLWEDGGPSTPENLLTSCRKCNKTRGNTSYADWLKHPYYRRVATNISIGQHRANAVIADRLHLVERVHQQRSR